MKMHGAKTACTAFGALAMLAPCVAPGDASACPASSFQVASTMPTPPKASRPSSPVVAPVELDGVRYEQDSESYRHGGDQPGGYLVAVDPKTGERLWMLKIYRVADHRAAGVGVMGRYFRSLAVVPGANELEIVNEAGGVYRVDVAGRSVRQVGGPAESDDASASGVPAP
jgi:hypothetical protein